MRVLIALPTVPFETGGAHVLVERLASALRERGHEAEVLRIPFKWYPNETLLAQPLIWRHFDVSEWNGKRIDRVIATKFPSWCVQHPCKVVWLFHRHRDMDDLWGTPWSSLDPTRDADLRALLAEADRRAFGECAGLFAISQEVANRLRNSLDLEAEVLEPPASAPDSAVENTVDAGSRGEPHRTGRFVVLGRLDPRKRVDLAIEAAHAAAAPLSVIGEGMDGERLRALAERLGGDVEFTGQISDADRDRRLAECRALVFVPFREDHGLATTEAFRLGKPVVTTTDAGGVLEWVEDGVTGWVSEPNREALAAALVEVMRDPDAVRKRGEAARGRLSRTSWDRVVQRLLAP